MFGFNPQAQFQQSGDLIPDGYACWAIANVRGYKPSQSTGGHYLDLELTVADGQPYNRRKVWTVVMDPADANNSEAGRQMGLAALQHMLEACGVFNAAQPETYAQFNASGIQGIANALQGKMVAMVVGIEKGKDGYADKNRVKKWLSPNPVSASFKEFQKLAAEGATVPASKTAPAAQQSFLGGMSPQPAAPIAPQGVAPAAPFGGGSIGAAPQPSISTTTTFPSSAPSVAPQAPSAPQPRPAAGPAGAPSWLTGGNP